MPAGAHDLALALAALRNGDLVGLPTETVYGLAADARNARAVAKIFALKGRPANHPLIVHLHNAEQMRAWARDIPPLAWDLAAHFWPGPLTLILPRAPGVLDAITGGQDSIGLRVPAHPMAQALLAAFDDGVAAPSANRFGHISPTTAAHVRDEFGAALPVVLDGGPCAVGIESTIVDVRAGDIRILRPGVIHARQLQAALRPETHAQQASLTAFATLNPHVLDMPRVPGALASHYAPRTPAFLRTRSAMQAPPAGILSLALGSLLPGAVGIALAAEPAKYAQGLYAALRALDARGADAIWVETLPEVAPDQADADWLALKDRLSRACNR
jgi:L-threonylcarbamoyladenylate synthase